MSKQRRYAWKGGRSSNQAPRYLRETRPQVLVLGAEFRFLTQFCRDDHLRVSVLELRERLPEKQQKHSKPYVRTTPLSIFQYCTVSYDMAALVLDLLHVVENQKGGELHR